MIKQSLVADAVINTEPTNLVGKHLDLKDAMVKLLEKELPSDEVELFLNNPLIVSTPGMTGDAMEEQDAFKQRVDINSFFVELLFIAKSEKEDLDILRVLPYLTAVEGRTEDWFALFQLYVLPFIKQHSLFTYLKG